MGTTETVRRGERDWLVLGARGRSRRICANVIRSIADGIVWRAFRYRDAVARYQINVADVQDAIQTAVGGNALTQVLKDEARYDLPLRYLPQYRSTQEAIENIRLLAPSGECVSLAQLCKIEERDGGSEIYREGNQRYVAIKYSVRGRDRGGAVEESMKKVNEQVSRHTEPTEGGPLHRVSPQNLTIVPFPSPSHFGNMAPYLRNLTRSIRFPRGDQRAGAQSILSLSLAPTEGGRLSRFIPINPSGGEEAIFSRKRLVLQ